MRLRESRRLALVCPESDVDLGRAEDPLVERILGMELDLPIEFRRLPEEEDFSSSPVESPSEEGAKTISSKASR